MIYSTNMKKLDKRGFRDDWKPPISLEIKKRILQKGEPTIEMKMTEDGVKAEVVLKYFDFIAKLTIEIILILELYQEIMLMFIQEL